MEQEIEQRLWEYIDGISSPEEKAVIQRLLAEDPLWLSKYTEIKDIHELLMKESLEMPSLRFTKNVMEEIAQFQVAPATRNYINKNVIRGIMAFFLVMILGFFVYFLAQIHWTGIQSNSLIPQSMDASRLNWSRLLNNSYIKIFIGISVMLGLVLLDKYMQTKKNTTAKVH